jgi:hypothetical protein
MLGSLVPTPDPTPLPGPPWLFETLWVLTFFLHLVMVNVTLGGALLAAFCTGGGRGQAAARRLLVSVNSWTISGAITLGIAPLLFIQVMLGRFFYSATILLGWVWLGLLLLLTVGYYLNYLAKRRLARGESATALLGVEAACFLAVAAIQVTVSLLHMQPGRWEAVAAHLTAALADPTWVPRFMHFVLAALATAGALVAWVGVRPGREPGERDAMARLGIRVALIATALQVVDGLALVVLLPRDVLLGLMKGGAVAMIPLTVGIVLALGLLVTLAMVQLPLEQPRLVRHASELLLGAMVVMVVTRHQVRSLYLTSARAGEELAVSPQWGVFAVFLVTLLGCCGLAVWALHRAATDRPSTGETPA